MYGSLSWPSLRYYPGISLHGLTRNMKNLSLDSRPRSEPGTFRLEAGALTFRLRGYVGNDEEYLVDIKLTGG
jgi:hypothetical protein